jgi:hypothetical protein
MRTAGAALRATGPYLLTAWALRAAAAATLIWPLGVALSKPPAPATLLRPADAALAAERLLDALPGALGWIGGAAAAYALAGRVMTLTWLSALAHPGLGARRHLRTGLTRLPSALLVGLLSLAPACLGLGVASLPLWLLPRVGASAQPLLGALAAVVGLTALLFVATWHDLALARLTRGRALRRALQLPTPRHLVRLCGRHGALLLAGAAVWAVGELLGRQAADTGLPLLVLPAHQGAALSALALRGLWLALLARE